MKNTHEFKSTIIYEDRRDTEDVCYWKSKWQDLYRVVQMLCEMFFKMVIFQLQLCNVSIFLRCYDHFLKVSHLQMVRLTAQPFSYCGTNCGEKGLWCVGFYQEGICSQSEDDCSEQLNKPACFLRIPNYLRYTSMRYSSVASSSFRFLRLRLISCSSSIVVIVKVVSAKSGDLEKREERE